MRAVPGTILPPEGLTTNLITSIESTYFLYEEKKCWCYNSNENDLPQNQTVNTTIKTDTKKYDNVS